MAVRVEASARDRSAPPLPAEPVFVEITVVDAKTAAPVAGADAWWGPGRIFFVLATIGTELLQSEVTGPGAVGQETEAILQVPDNWTALTGRVLATDGAPLALTKLAVAGATHESGFDETLVTDADGRLVLFLGDPDRSGGDLWSLTLTRSVDGKGIQRGEIGARSLSCGRNDLGDIRLHEEP